jgi:hypothetical protein
MEFLSGGLDPMFRKNWMLVVALAGWATLCPSGDGSFAQSGFSTAQQPAQTQQLDLGPLNDALKNIESAIKSAKPDAKSADDIAHDKEREQKSDIHEGLDLQAQQDAARAAERSAKAGQGQENAAWGQFALSFLGTVLLLVSLKYTRDALKLTSRALDESRKASAAAEASVVVASDTAKKQLRAYVYVDEITVENIDDPTNAYAKIMIKNGGQTPAYELRNKTGRVIRLVNDDSDFPMIGPVETGSKSVMNPTGISKIRVDLDYSNDVISAIQDGRVILFLFGRIIYRDAFGDEQESCFRCMYSGLHRDPKGGMTFCSEGNEAT